jgi:hypothetical protein
MISMSIDVAITADRNVIKKEDEMITGKARNQGITETKHIVHCTQTAGSDNVKVQNIFYGRNNITCNTNCKYRTVAILNILGTPFFSGT